MHLQRANGVGESWVAGLATPLPVDVMLHAVFEHFPQTNTGRTYSLAILLIDKAFGAFEYLCVHSYCVQLENIMIKRNWL